MCLSLGGITAAPLVYHRFWSLDYGLAAPFTTNHPDDSKKIMMHHDFFAVIGMSKLVFK